MISYIIWAIFFYFLFRFILNIATATRQMRSQIKDFQQRMQGQRPQYQTSSQPDGSNYTSSTSNASKPKSTSKAGDYIDFEEIK